MARIGLPVAWPAPAVTDGAQDSRRERLFVNLVTVEIVLLVLTQKIAVPLGEESQIQLALVLHYAFIAIYAASTGIHVHGKRLILYLALLSAATLAHALTPAPNFSSPSLFLFAVIYFMYVFVVDIRRSVYLDILKRFQLIVLAVAGLVASNWLTQIVGLGMPNIELVVPEKFLFDTYVYIQPVHWGSPYTKPNAIFFLETSSTSQFLAFGLIIELCLFRRLFHTGAMLAGLLLTFGGTGLLLILLSAPFILFYLRPVFAMALLICAPLVILGASTIGLVDNASKRSTEFSQQGSSANQRFLAPIESIDAALNGDGARALFGNGAGNMPRALNIVWNPVSKMFVEYGLIAFVAWLVFQVTSVFGHGVPFVVSWMVFMAFQLLNGSLIVPINSMYCIMLASLYSVNGNNTRNGSLAIQSRLGGFRSAAV